MAREVTPHRTALFANYGDRLLKLLPETDASQVRMGDSTVESRLLALERGGMGDTEFATLCGEARAAIRETASLGAALEEKSGANAAKISALTQRLADQQTNIADLDATAASLAEGQAQAAEVVAALATAQADTRAAVSHLADELESGLAEIADGLGARINVVAASQESIGEELEAARAGIASASQLASNVAARCVEMSGATAQAAGSAGLVPQPLAGQQDSFLRGDGTWQTPPDTTYGQATANEPGLMSAADKKKLDGIAAGATNTAQPPEAATAAPKAPGTATVGTSVKYAREDHVHPSDNTTYGAMTGASAAAAGKAGLVPAPAAGAQARYLRGDGTWQTPPDTNTTYAAMTGASTSAAGKAGLVPAPAAGAANRYLRSDGSWQVPPDTNTTYGAATQSANGLMSAADKKKLDGIAAGAQVNPTNYVTTDTEQQITGVKHFAGPNGTSAWLRNNDDARASKPAADRWHSWGFEDKAGLELGGLGHSHTTAGTHEVFLKTVGQTGAAAWLSLSVTASGVAVAAAPTPAAGSGSGEIATTLWVRNFVAAAATGASVLSVPEYISERVAVQAEVGQETVAQAGISPAAASLADAGDVAQAATLQAGEQAAGRLATTQALAADAVEDAGHVSQRYIEVRRPLTTDEKFAYLRLNRDLKLLACDGAVARLGRALRASPGNAAISGKLAAWDEYAQALCDLPALPGAPWDGGGELTPWPPAPA